jgi:hypothetical protein
MSFTFTNDPANSDRDALRILVNDRTETGHDLSDETIAWLLTENGNVYYAAAQAAEIIGSQYTSSVAEKQVGDLKIKRGDSSGDVAGKYKQLAQDLRRQGGIAGFNAFSGGISIADKDDELSDSDRPQDEAAVGMHDAVAVAASTSGRWDF